MTSEEFRELYTEVDSDESIVSLKDAIGFTLVRRYQLGSEYDKDNRRIFIILYLAGEAVKGGVEMVNADKEGSGSYSVVFDGKDRKRVTNFWFGDKEGIIFDAEKNRISYKSRDFTINQFIDILVDNHLSDRTFLKRKLNHLVNLFLRFIFWLFYQSYDSIKVSLKLGSSSYIDEYDKGKAEDVEPFFKYFSISKNILFIVLIIASFLSLKAKSMFSIEDFSISNPTLILFVCLILFLLEKLSIFLDRSIKDFFDKKVNFISRLHNFQFSESFKLKIKNYHGKDSLQIKSRHILKYFKKLLTTGFLVKSFVNRVIKALIK